MRHRLDYLSVEVDYQYARSLVNCRSLNGCTLSNTIAHFGGPPASRPRDQHRSSEGLLAALDYHPTNTTTLHYPTDTRQSR